MNESLPRLVAYILGLYLVFIPLLWSWIRCALSLMENIRKNRLEHPIVWRRILNIVPGITIGILIAVFLCSVACLLECVHEGKTLAILAGLLGALSLLVAGTIFQIWKAIFSELVTLFDRMGS